MDFEKLYCLYNKRQYVHPDPLEFLYKYENSKDRELVAIVASSLAYGRVNQILKSVDTVLSKMQDSPYVFLTNTSDADIKKIFKNFKHRFTDAADLSFFLIGLKKMILEYKTIKNYFISFNKNNYINYIPILNLFVKFIKQNSKQKNSLLSEPELGSACKRLHLFLRWMIRKDEVDLGDWSEFSASKLIIPLDTHMYNFGKQFNFTKRKNADIKTAIEITEAFKKISSNDPVKYDFTITRFGIRKDFDKKNINKVSFYI